MIVIVIGLVIVMMEGTDCCTLGVRVFGGVDVMGFLWLHYYWWLLLLYMFWWL